MLSISCGFCIFIERNDNSQLETCLYSRINPVNQAVNFRITLLRSYVVRCKARNFWTARHHRPDEVNYEDEEEKELELGYLSSSSSDTSDVSSTSELTDAAD